MVVSSLCNVYVLCHYGKIVYMYKAQHTMLTFTYAKSQIPSTRFIIAIKVLKESFFNKSQTSFPWCGLADRVWSGSAFWSETLFPGNFSPHFVFMN